jgi:hypothetical protein
MKQETKQWLEIIFAFAMIAFIVWIVLTMGKVMAQGNKSRAEESNFKWPRWLKISYHVPRSKDGLGGL